MSISIKKYTIHSFYGYNLSRQPVLADQHKCKSAKSDVFAQTKASAKLCLRLLIVERILSHKANILVVDDLLGASDKEDSSGRKRCKILSENVVLGFLRKVYENISAYDEVIILRIWITKKVSLLEGNSGLDLF